MAVTLTYDIELHSTIDPSIPRTAIVARAHQRVPQQDRHHDREPGEHDDVDCCDREAKRRFDPPAGERTNRRRNHRHVEKERDRGRPVQPEPSPFHHHERQEQREERVQVYPRTDADVEVGGGCRRSGRASFPRASMSDASSVARTLRLAERPPNRRPLAFVPAVPDLAFPNLATPDRAMSRHLYHERLRRTIPAKASGGVVAMSRPRADRHGCNRHVRRTTGRPPNLS